MASNNTVRLSPINRPQSKDGRERQEFICEAVQSLRVINPKHSVLEETDYYSPSDRIARNYSLTARALTISTINETINASMLSPKKKLSSKIGKDEESSASPLLGSSKSTPSLKNNVSIHPNSMKSRHTSSTNSLRVISPSKKQKKMVKSPKSKFMNWNPVAEDAIEIPGSNNNHIENNTVDTKPSSANGNVAQTYEQKKEQVVRCSEIFLNKAANLKIFDVGGKSIEIEQLSKSSEHAIIKKLPDTSLVSQERRDSQIDDMFTEVHQLFMNASREAILMYQLKSPGACDDLAINPVDLRQPDTNWINRYYLNRNWRILRRVKDVEHSRVEQAFTSIADKLIINPSLVELQQLWLQGTPLVEESVNGEPDPVSAAALSAQMVDTPYASMRFVELTKFQRDLPLEPNAFLNYFQAAAAAVRTILKEAWLPAASDVMSRCVEKLYEKTKSNLMAVDPNNKEINHQAQAVLRSASTLMSKQVRDMTDSSIASCVEFFDGIFASASTEGDGKPFCVFVVRTALESDGSAVKIEPSIDSLVEVMKQSIEYIVVSSGRLPRVDGNQYLFPCEMDINNHTLLDAQARLSSIIYELSRRPEELLLTFARYLHLFNGQEQLRVEQLLEQRTKAQNTRQGLKLLQKVVDEYAALQERIRAEVQDSYDYPLLQIDCQGLKKVLCDRIAQFSHRIQEVIAGDNREIMLGMCSKFTEVMTRLLVQPEGSEELRQLILYAQESPGIIKELERKITTEVFARISFAVKNDHQLADSDVSLITKLYCFPAQLWDTQKRSDKLQEEQRRMRIGTLERRRELFADELSRCEEDVAKLVQFTQLTPDNITATVSRIEKIKDYLASAEEEIDAIRDQEELLGQDVSAGMWLTRHATICKNLQPFTTLWSTAVQHFDQANVWKYSPLSALNAEDVERESDNIRRTMMKLLKEFERREVSELDKPICQMRDEAATFLNDYVPLMVLLCNPGLRERHWVQIAEITGISDLKYYDNINLDYVVSLKLHEHVEAIEDTCVNASKEFSLEKNMDKMEEEWKPLEFVCKLYRETGTYTVGGVDEIQTLLDDHIVKAQAMRSSRYILPYVDRIKAWEHTLVSLQDILDNWLKLQSVWLYLEPIFGSPDIIKQMPSEAKLFQEVDDIWRKAVNLTAETPSVITTAQRPGLLEDLTKANEIMEVIQKGLNDYLEQKRLFFPRFFFLSNDELLEILSETKDPLRVQPHLKKCFEGINELRFTDDLDITAMISPQKEVVDFVYEAIKHETINPNATGGNVELWLLQTEMVMRRSVAYALDNCMKAYAESSSRIEWVKQWQGQCLIATSQTFWTQQVEKTLKENGNKGLYAYYDVLQTQLQDIVQLVRGQLPKLLRTAIGAMVTLDVHSRDTVQQLAKLGVENETDFDWMAQLRYYWYDNSESALTGKPASVDVKMITACRKYDYEYLGCSGRLVVTPLTDRCYRTLMGAIQLMYGGAPEGPAGTGKTETTKDLGKAVAVQTVVFNCSDGLDYLAMGKFFKGLLASGAWACFDEFNRIELEVLSVVAQQILTITRGKIAGVEMLEFEGTTLPLRIGCNVYITMNPGYAGRSDLPDNLKALFRPCAMMVPDYAMIGEIILYSMGYLNGKVLAQKIVATYRLCSEQLSSQKHYDYGMRAVMSVLRAAGAQKRKKENADTDEAVLMLRSIIDVNEAKFLSQDMPLFKGIVGDLFPGIVIPKSDTKLFDSAFQRACKALYLQPVDSFYVKVKQVYEMMLVRHGFMIVGLPFGGKTAAWKCLQFMMTLLHEENPSDKRWQTVVDVVINPKSISMGLLYGQFDPSTHEWSDGVLAIKYRDCANNKIGQPEDRKWVMFDGPVDAIWIENMNTVLDDNKKLCLQSGEMVALSDEMSMMFEPMDLEVASPATVSRCGVIFCEPHRLGWTPLLNSWLSNVTSSNGMEPDETDLNTIYQIDFNTCKSTRKLLHLNPPKFFISHKQKKLIKVLFEWFIDPCILYMKRYCYQVAPTIDSNMVVSCINLFESCLVDILFNNLEKLEQDDGVQKKPAAAQGSQQPAETSDSGSQSRQLTDNEIETAFLFALTWSVGGATDSKGQISFSDFVRQMIDNQSVNYIKEHYEEVYTSLLVKEWMLPDFTELTGNDNDIIFEFKTKLPDKKLMHELLFSHQEEKYVTWIDLLDKNFVIPSEVDYSSIVVPTINTQSYSYLLKLLIINQKPALCIGNTGTGKSTYINQILLKELPKTDYASILTAFSAQTSSSMLQEIIDSKLDRRRKGVFGPPLGKNYVLFVDDVNMPEVEEYGAQPPIELLRQLIDNGGWYDMKEKSFKKIVDTLLVCAMAPPGGSRNYITPRMMRHFNVLSFLDSSDETLMRIFNTITTWHFNKPGFTTTVRSMAKGIVKATLDVYRTSMKELLPTPTKSHYTFNLRDFSRVIQGILLTSPSDETIDNKFVVRLWTHELLRVFSDRLINDEDRQWFLDYIQTLTQPNFKLKFHECFETLSQNSKQITTKHLRSLFYGNYMDANASPKIYTEIADRAVLDAKLEEYLAEYNAMSKQPMSLVLFLFAIEHVSRISRIISMPGGNALLVGVGGSGRQSLTKLATFIQDHNIIQIEISKSYNTIEWAEDLKKVIRTAGLGTKDCVFLFNDSQVKYPSFVEDLNNLLNASEVPNLFPNDEKNECIENVRPFAKQQFGKKAIDMSAAELWSFFVKRVRSKLHIVLAFSPIGNEFRVRLRKYPSLINCCSIDWFTAWPEDALVAVAEKFLADLTIDKTETLSSESIRHEIVLLCQYFHSSIEKLTEYFKNAFRRINYVTPTSYLELILAYKSCLAACREKVLNARQRYVTGLEKLQFAASQVGEMQVQLTDLQPVLEQSKKDTDALMEKIKEKLPGVNATKEAVGKDAAIAQKEADRVGAIKRECEDDLAVAMPILHEAIAALDTLKPSDIGEVKNFKTPPAGVVLTMEAVCVMLNVKCAKMKDPNDPTRKVDDWWTPSKKLLADPKFLQTLKDYDRDNINPKFMKIIRSKFSNNPDFEPDKVRKASVAACGMCKWVNAMEAYDRVAKVVAPKKIALAEAEEKLAVTMSELDEKKAALKAVEDELKALEDQFDAATQKKVDLENEVELCGQKLIRAKTLIDGLGGEKERWTDAAKKLLEQYQLLTGDVLVAGGAIAYLGPFTSNLRDEQMKEWVSLCIEKGIPCSADPTLFNTLGDPVETSQWQVHGLPTDSFSVDNGIIVFNGRRWPLMIDPQGQANKWIRSMEKENQLHVIKLTDGNYLRTVENAVQFGHPVLLENIGETLDAALEPLLLKTTFKQGGVVYIRLGDSTIEFSDSFRFYITTKLPNPHYLPEVAVKVTLINFMITPTGLEEQLLGITVEQERPDLAEEKARLIVDGAENRRKLKELEDNILSILSSSSGNILEDESAINALNESKVLSNEIQLKQVAAKETELQIDEVRQGYRPVAYHGQLLYFCIADLAAIEPVYQYSLTWFTNLFVSAIQNSEPSSDFDKRLTILKDFFTYSLYNNVCRSLLEKDKLLFAFLLTYKIMLGRDEMDSAEWYFLLTGGVAMDNKHVNPVAEWLAPKSWNEICLLAEINDSFSGLRESFADDAAAWRAIYDSNNSHTCTFPGRWDELSSFQKMCVLRCVRPDKMSLAIHNFVIENIGEEFVKPPQFDLQACYNDSNALSPLVFILSPGSDPMTALLKFSDSMKQQVSSISLGQGQGPIAEKMIAKAQLEGSWVVLQNCHLAVSWMQSFEAICEEITLENTHVDFRMWCTTYPSKDFPVIVLQNGVKMTNEPPKGLRANLVGSYMNDPINDNDFFNSVKKDEVFHKLLFGLCLFHALVQERRQFGALGWNTPYEFNDSDLRICVKQLAFFVDQFDETPFKALRYCTGECNYGGRVTDDKDRRALHVILNRCYSPEMLQDGFALSESGKYTVPEHGCHGDYLAHIESLPGQAEPEVFNMHANATITKDKQETTSLFSSILLTQSNASSGDSGASPDQVKAQVAADILDKLPDDFNLELAQVRYPIKWDESMNTVLHQELVRYNRLLAVVRPSLQNLVKALKGTIVMSNELEKVGNALFFGLVPSLWDSKSYPSLKPLAGYVQDLIRRLTMLGDWLTDKPPTVFWISGFYFTQAFLTGTMQNFARSMKIPIDNVLFNFVMMPKQADEYDKPPQHGAYTYGLFFDGARWDYEAEMLADPLPKVLFSAAPVMHLVPAELDKEQTNQHYNCPVYKTSERRGVLATTGHSSNFVMFMKIPSDKSQDFWIERGVALLTQLDD